ncbi:preprotein translocase subunit YajC [Pseudomonas aeruginosa]|nr:preprotein translocase subunit YajC [Pseudomonas aeruginosa]
MSFLIPAAYADAAAPAAAGPAGTGFEWVFLVGFLVIFYLMILASPGQARQGTQEPAGQPAKR